MATTIRHDLNKLLKAAYTTAYSFHNPPLFTQTPAGIKEDRAVADTLQKGKLTASHHQIMTHLQGCSRSS